MLQVVTIAQDNNFDHDYVDTFQDNHINDNEYLDGHHHSIKFS